MSGEPISKPGPLASVRPAVWGIEPYKPGKPIAEVQRELGLTEVQKLASNENPLGPSPKAMAALRDAIGSVNLYPETSCYYLRKALAGKFNVAEDQILLGNGANEIVEMVAHAFLEPGDEAIQSEASFAMYPVAVQLMNGKNVYVPCRPGWKHDLEGFLKAVTPRTKLIFVCNPNNPTGTIVSREELSRFLARVPPHILVVIDEAYCDFVDDPDYPLTIPWLAGSPNLLLVRTLSKIAGLAGIRVGYAFGQAPVIAAIERTREPFNVNSLAQVAATAALSDDEHARKTLENNRAGRKYLSEEFARMGLKFTPSHANFLFVEFDRPAAGVFQALLQRGLIIRPMGGKLAHAARISIGTPEQNRRLVEAMGQVLGVSVSQ